MAQSVSKAGGVRGMYAGHTSVAEGGGGCQFIEADAHLYQGTGESHSLKRKPDISRIAHSHQDQVGIREVLLPRKDTNALHQIPFLDLRSRF